uniref:Uncharacterized protein n=1 Tax=Nelumbo nucifera TaxID=4432 RepID=A0A822ZRK5_NELNU|nr:TPA_asm: hypothetical protein HUJ06_004209 [Nelumbo nucifera]
MEFLAFLRFSSARKIVKIVAMAPKRKVLAYNENWQKQWYGKLEKNVLSNVEKAGLLSRAEKLGFTLSSIERLEVLSKAEEFGLLNLIEKAVSFSPATLALVALLFFVAGVNGC